MGKYESDVDTVVFWPSSATYPAGVSMHIGETIEFPPNLWNGPNGARTAALAGLNPWVQWNCGMHPNPVHRAWAADQSSETMELLRKRAISVLIPG